MRRLILLFAVILALFGGYSVYWFRLSDQVHARIEAWRAEQAERGRMVAAQDILVDGYPFRMEVTARGVVATQDQGGVAQRLEVPELVAHLQPWRPHHAIVVGHGPFIFYEESDQRSLRTEVDAEQALASLVFGNDGELDRLAIDFHAAKVRVESGEDGSSFDVERAQFHSRALPGAPSAQEAAVKLERITFADMDDNPLGKTLDIADATVIQYGKLEPPLNGPRLDAWRAEGGKVALERLHLTWGELRLDGDGNVGLDTRRRPSGAFNFSLVGHDAVLDAMVEGGMIENKDRALALALLTPLTKVDDSGTRRIEIPLVMDNGMLTLGGMPIAELEPIL